MNSSNEIISSETQRLHPTLARRLTVELGACCFGDDFRNPDVYGTFKHFETRNWKQPIYRENPEPFDREIERQITVAQDIAKSFLGKAAVAKTRELGVFMNGRWELWCNDRTASPSSRAPFFIDGVISGVEGHPLLTRWFASNRSLRGIRVAPPFPEIPNSGSYAIGLTMEATSEVRSNLSLDRGGQFPQPERVLIPLRSLPKSDAYNGLFANQLQ